MKKFNKIAAGFSAVLLTAALSAAPVSAITYKNALDYHDYDYFLSGNVDSCGLNGMYIYKDGTGVNELKFYQQYILTPADGIKLTPELLNLPKKYKLITDNKDGTVRLDKLIDNVKGIENTAIQETRDLVTTWLRKGLISKADIEYSAVGKCLKDPRIAVKVIDEADPAEVAADYTEYELTTDRTGVPQTIFDLINSHFLYTDADFYSRPVKEGEIFSDGSDECFYHYISRDIINRNIYEELRNKKNAGYYTGELDPKLENRVQWAHAFGSSCCDDEHIVSKTVPFFDEYGYLDDPENIVWEDNINGNVILYKNGSLYRGRGKVTAVFCKPVIPFDEWNITLTLPDKYYLEQFENGVQIEVKTQEECEEVKNIVREWAENGIVKEPSVKNYYFLSKCPLTIYVKLENTDNDDSFIADHSELTFNKIGLSSGYYNGELQCDLSAEQLYDYHKLLSGLKADSRVKEAFGSAIDDCTVKYIKDVPVPIEYKISTDMNDDPQYLDEEPPVLKGDANLDGKVDLYDAINIAEFIAGKKELTAAEQISADINGDGKVDIYDAIGVCTNILRQ